MNSIVKSVGAVALIGIAVVAVAMILDGGDGGRTEEDVEADLAIERAEAARARAESLKVALDTIYAQYVSARLRDSVRRAELEERIERSRVQADEAARDALDAADSLGAILRSLHDAVRPGLRPVVDTASVRLDTLQAAHGRQVARLEEVAARRDSQRRSAVATLDSVEATLDACRSSLDACRTSRDSAFVAIRKLEDARETSFWERLGESAPEIIGKAGALTAACALPKGDARLAACAGAGSIVLVDLAL